MRDQEDLQLVTNRQWKVLLGVALASRGYKGTNPRRICAKDVSRCINNRVGNMADVLTALSLKNELLSSHEDVEIATGRKRVIYKLTTKGKDYLNYRIKYEQATV